MFVLWHQDFELCTAPRSDVVLLDMLWEVTWTFDRKL
jgi:hypothetical protein